MKKTKIIATLGPASWDEDTMSKMIRNGLNVVRINMSHAVHEKSKEQMNFVRKINKKNNTNVGILVDTKGPEIRTGRFKDGEITLKEGSTVLLNNLNETGDEKEFSIDYDNLIKDVKQDDDVVLNDGLVTLHVLKNDGEKLRCIVENTATIADKRSVNLPGVELTMPFMSEKDRDDIEFAIKENADFLALSFVSRKEDILEVKEILQQHGNSHISIISKIENRRALENIDEIIESSEGIMIARGDLGVEVPLEQLPVIQKMLIKKSHAKGKLCIVATEMLATMEENPRPTRAEVSDVSNAVLMATDAIMLSGETATGKYPSETVDTMAKIAIEAEKLINYEDLLRKSLKSEELDVTGTIAYSVANAANILTPKAIVATTRSGYTARKVSRFRPKCPIVVTSPDENTIRKLSMHFGVYAYKVDEFKNTDDIILNAKEISKETLNLQNKDSIIITGGIATSKLKATNFMKIEEI